MAKNKGLKSLSTVILKEMEKQLQDKYHSAMI